MKFIRIPILTPRNSETELLRLFEGANIAIQMPQGTKSVNTFRFWRHVLSRLAGQTKALVSKWLPPGHLEMPAYRWLLSSL